MKKRKSLYRQNVTEIILARVLVLVFATRDLQNDMFCQLAEPESDFPVGLEVYIVGRQKEYLI